MSKSDAESGKLSGKTIGVGRRLHCALDVFSDVSVTAALMLIIVYRPEQTSHPDL